MTFIPGLGIKPHGEKEKKAGEQGLGFNAGRAQPPCPRLEAEEDEAGNHALGSAVCCRLPGAGHSVMGRHGVAGSSRTGR